MRKYERVVVGYRVVGTTKDEFGVLGLRPLSRVFAARQAAEDFVALAKTQGIDDAYLQSVERPERRELGMS